MALETPDEIAQWREDRRRKWPRLNIESKSDLDGGIVPQEKCPRLAIDTRESGPAENKKRVRRGTRGKRGRREQDGGNVSSQQPEPGAASTSAIEVSSSDSEVEDGDQSFQSVEDEGSMDEDSSENNRRDIHKVDSDEVRYEDDTDLEGEDVDEDLVIDENRDILKNDAGGDNNLIYINWKYNNFKVPISEYHPRYSPYADLLSQFKPNLWQLEKSLPVKSPMMETTTLTIVDTELVLLEMLSALKRTVELAIDFRMGNTQNSNKHRIVIQISSRTEDFLVDCQQLQKQQMILLNEVFANPSILKVVNFLGRNRIFVLARYCGIYIVNAFNVRTAEMHLKIVNSNPIYGVNRRLQHILKEQCDIAIGSVSYSVIPKNGIQLSEASEEMLTNLREDTHYLLHLHDVYRNKLVFMKSLDKVYEQSTFICRGENGEVLQPDTYKKKIRYMRLQQLNVQEHECFRLVHDWAWITAKEKGRRFEKMMPRLVLEKISKTLPRTLEDLEMCYGRNVPRLVKDKCHILFKLVGIAIDKFPNPKPIKNRKERKEA